MGAAQSLLKGNPKVVKSVAEGKSLEQIVKLVMPIYYSEENVTAEELKLVTDSWALILEDKSTIYRDRKKNDATFPYQSCCTFFYDSFYVRLFDVHPDCRSLFRKSIRTQGRLLMKLISMCLLNISDTARTSQTLKDIAVSHYGFGVQVVECKKHLFYSLFPF
jgi:hypothetical protein